MAATPVRASLVFAACLAPMFTLAAPLVREAPDSLKIHVDAPAVRYVGRMATIEIKVTNTEKRKLEKVTVKAALPAEAFFQEADNAGVYRDGAVSWTLGALDAGATTMISFKVIVRRKTPSAKFAVQATGDGQAHGLGIAAVEFIALPAARLEVIDSDDPIKVGEKTTYKIDVTNQGSEDLTDVRLVAKAPKEFMEIVSTTGPEKGKIEGQCVTFPSVATLKPGQSVSYTVRVKALKREGDIRFRVELKSREFGKTPVVEEECTRIYK